jgi:hypothetical protein
MCDEARAPHKSLGVILDDMLGVLTREKPFDRDGLESTLGIAAGDLK